MFFLGTGTRFGRNGRLIRIAAGSGRREKDVRDLLSRYRQTKIMMKASKGREFRQLMRRMGGQTGNA